MKVGVDNETLDVKQVCVVEKEVSLKGILGNILKYSIVYFKKIGEPVAVRVFTTIIIHESVHTRVLVIMISTKHRTLQ